MDIGQEILICFLISTGCMLGFCSFSKASDTVPDEFCGVFQASSPEGNITLELKKQSSADYIGRLNHASFEYMVSAKKAANGVRGILSSFDRVVFGFYLRVGPYKNQVALTLYTPDIEGNPVAGTQQTLMFVRQSASYGIRAEKTDEVSSKSTDKSDRGVFVNGRWLDAQTLKHVQSKYGIKVRDGRYWYDSKCGAWGIEGGPTLGFILPNLSLGGDLQVNSSNGNTGVFINGRQLPVQDLQALYGLTGPIAPGRYWLDSRGNAGLEGQPAIVNLLQLHATMSRNAKSSFYRNSYLDHGSGSSGNTSYVMGKDWSYISD